MEAQTFEERMYGSDSTDEPTDQDTDSLAVVDEVPVAREDPMELDGDLAPEAPVEMDAVLVPETPADETLSHQAPLDANAGPPEALLSPVDSEHFRTRWSEIQGKFVDEPRSAVQQADALVAEVTKQITQMFANESSALEGKWKEGDDVSTEDLRQALRHYRSFFNRLMV